MKTMLDQGGVQRPVDLMACFQGGWRVDTKVKPLKDVVRVKFENMMP
jgi:hypothetical protein